MVARTFLDYFSLGVIIFVILTLVYGLIYVHDIPYEIAKKRKHPHQDAIHAAGWLSLFLLHALWPFLWVWALVYKPDENGFATDASSGRIEDIENRLSQLESQLAPNEEN